MNIFPYTIESVNNDQENWGLKSIKVNELWEQGITGKGSIVAVIDTGCDIHHESLSDNIIGGANFTNDYSSDFNNYQDNNGHGTHVAGIIAGNNQKFKVGVAPTSKLLILKALSYSGGGSIISVTRALHYAATWRGVNDEKVDIVCLSLGTPKDDPILKEAIQYLVTKNIAVVVASGNDGDGTIKEEYRYPGYYNEVIQVGAIEKEMNPATYSNNNKEIDLVAPGSSIFSTFLDNNYRNLSGTSMATPFVAGALALLKQQGKQLLKRDLTEAELYAQLIKSTKLLGDYVAYSGNGVLDLSRSFK
jgi:major intracellular serine protease